MIEFLSSWAKGLGLSIVVVSILEMLLPNNKTKKYIRMVMGIYVLFTIISPFIENKELLDVNNIDFEEYMTTQTSTEVDQTSMNKRIEELYVEELEKDITKKVEDKGYVVTKCKVDAQISSEEEETKINKITLNIEKSSNQAENLNIDEGSESQNGDVSIENTENENNSLENKIVIGIQKIKPINTSISTQSDNNQSLSDEDEKSDNSQPQSSSEEKSKIKNEDIQNIKKFLIEEYGVSEKCLKIN